MIYSGKEVFLTRKQSVTVPMENEKLSSIIEADATL